MYCHFCGGDKVELIEKTSECIYASPLDTDELHEVNRSKERGKCMDCGVVMTNFREDRCWCGFVHPQIGNCKKEWWFKKDGKWEIS